MVYCGRSWVWIPPPFFLQENRAIKSLFCHTKTVTVDDRPSINKKIKSILIRFLRLVLLQWFRLIFNKFFSLFFAVTSGQSRASRRRARRWWSTTTPTRSGSRPGRRTDSQRFTSTITSSTTPSGSLEENCRTTR